MAGHLELTKNFDLDTFIIGYKAKTVAGTTTGARVSMAKAHALAFLIISGTTMTAKLTASLLQATAATGGTPKAIAGKSCTFAAGAGGINKVKVLEVESSELDVANQYDYVALKLKFIGAGKIAGVACVRGPNRYNPL